VFEAINIFCEPTVLLTSLNAGSGVPANALLDQNGNPILDENGNYILT
jgi:hypothetical protein